MSSEPLVSIITPCYNGARYLPGYFGGILAQEHRNIELIFIDDGSTDDTAAVARAYGEQMVECGMRFTYIYQENAGQCAAINKGLACFSGDYMLWLDSDDILAPDNISAKLSFLAANPECGFVLNGVEIVDATDTSRSLGVFVRRRPSGEDNYFGDLLHQQNVIFAPGTMLVRREALLHALPTRHIYESTEGQNYQLLLPLAYTAKVGYIERPLIKYLVHGDSHSHRERSFAEQYELQDEGILVCTTTLAGIPGITAEDLDYWCREVRLLHNRCRLRLAATNFSRAYYERAKKLLAADNYRPTLKESYLALACYQALKMCYKRLKFW